MIPSPNICHVNVGGTQFTFSRASFEQFHMQDTIISKTVLGKNSDVVPYFDVDPKLFEKWIAPYIRQEVLPNQEKLKSSHKRDHLIRAANTVGLIALAQYVEQIKLSKVIKIGICFFKSSHPNYPSGVNYFCNVIAPTTYFKKIHCPDLECPAWFCPTDDYALQIFLNHFRASPHNGTVTVYEKCGTGNGFNEHGIIECEMLNFKELTMVEGNKLDHKKDSK